MDIIDSISRALSYFEPGYRYAMAFKLGHWDGRKRLLQKTLKFPSGLVSKVQKVLGKHKIEFTVEKEFDYPEPAEPLEWNGFELRPYQQEIVDIALEEQGGMIQAPTGAGKTIVISAITAHYNQPTMIYVVSLDLLSQMQEMLEDSLGIEVGIIGGGQCDIRKITICSVWTAGLACGEKAKTEEEDIIVDKWTPAAAQRAEIREAVENARLAILDEAHFAAANSIQMILRYSKSAVYKFGLTATPWRSGGDDILLVAVFGNTIYEISLSELVRMGYLVPAKIMFRDIPELAKNPERKWPIVKSKYISNNGERDELLIRNTMKLLEMKRRPLVLFRELAHGKRLLSMFPPDVRTRMVTGQLSRPERDEIRREFKDGNVDVLLASTVYDQGIDIKELDALVLCSGGKSTARALQRLGRVLRIDPASGKKDAYIVETYDQCHFVEDHSIIRWNIYATESEFTIKTGPIMQARLDRRRR